MPGLYMIVPGRTRPGREAWSGGPREEAPSVLDHGSLEIKEKVGDHERRGRDRGQHGGDATGKPP